MTPEQVLELLDTNRKILATNKLILEEVQQVRAITRELTEARMLRRQQEAERQRKRRKAEKEKSLEGRLVTPANLWRSDKRLHENGTYKRWALVGIRFGLRGHTGAFLRYLMHDWNTKIYTIKPVTKTNGGLHIFMGAGSTRFESSAANMFGSERSFCPVKAGEAKIFDWGINMMHLLRTMESMPDFDKLPKDFVQCLQFVAGGYADMTESGTLKIRGHVWDPADGRELFPRVAEFKSLYVRCMRALRCGMLASDAQMKTYLEDAGLMGQLEESGKDYSLVLKLAEDLKREAIRAGAKDRFLCQLKAQAEARHAEEQQVQKAIEMSLQPNEPVQVPAVSVLVLEPQLGGNEDEKKDV